jgi:hypothetical protein
MRWWLIPLVVVSIATGYSSAQEPAVVRESPPPLQKLQVPGTIRVHFFSWAAQEQISTLLAEHGLLTLRVEGRTHIVRVPQLDQTQAVIAALNRSPLVECAAPHYVLVRRPERPPRIVPQGP